MSIQLCVKCILPIFPSWLLVIKAGGWEKPRHVNLTSVSAQHHRGPPLTSMSLRFSSLQRRRGLLVNFAIIGFIAFFAVAVIFSTRCTSQASCTHSDVIEDRWLSLWGLRSSNEKEWSSIDDCRGSAAIEDEEDVIGPAYCPVCGLGDALCAKYGCVI